MRLQVGRLRIIPLGSLLYKEGKPWGYLERVFLDVLNDSFVIKDYQNPHNIREVKYPYYSKYDYMIPTDFSQIEFLHDKKVKKPRSLKKLYLGILIIYGVVTLSPEW